MTDPEHEDEINNIGISVAAKATHAMFKVFIESGFTREEAFALVKIQFTASMAAAYTRRSGFFGG